MRCDQELNDQREEEQVQQVLRARAACNQNSLTSRACMPSSERRLLCVTRPRIVGRCWLGCFSPLSSGLDWHLPFTTYVLVVARDAPWACVVHADVRFLRWPVTTCLLTCRALIC